MNGTDKKYFKELLEAHREYINAKFDNVYEKLENTANQITGRHAILIDLVKANTDNIQVIKSQTTFFRWCQRNYKLAVIMFIVFIALIVYGINEIGLSGLINLAK